MSYLCQNLTDFYQYLATNLFNRMYITNLKHKVQMKWEKSKLLIPNMNIFSSIVYVQYAVRKGSCERLTFSCWESGNKAMIHQAQAGPSVISCQLCSSGGI